MVISHEYEYTIDGCADNSFITFTATLKQVICLVMTQVERHYWLLYMYMIMSVNRKK